MGKNKRRISRIIYCEWHSQSGWTKNTGGIICKNCNFSRTLQPGEQKGTYTITNKLIDVTDNCPNCHTNNNWYWLPPIARVPRKNASKRIWKIFYKNLEERKFNHPKFCR